MAASPTSVPHGKLVAISISLTPGDQDVDGLQFSVTLPPGWTIGTPILTPGTAAIPKFLAFNMTNGSVFCLIYGLNVLPIPAGPFLDIPLVSPIQTPPGPVDVALTGLVASSSAGVSIPITGTGTTVSVERHHWWRRQPKNKPQ
jgi:hypothetical protein